MKEILLSFIIALVISSMVNSCSQPASETKTDLSPEAPAPADGSSTHENTNRSSITRRSTQRASTNRRTADRAGADRTSSDQVSLEQSSSAGTNSHGTSSDRKSSPPATAKAGSQVIETSESGFENDVLKATGPVLVEFGASWCPACQEMAPVLKEIASQYSGKLKVFHVDVDKNKNLEDLYAQGGLPTFIVFKSGQPRQMQSGSLSRQELLTKMIKPNIS